MCRCTGPPPSTPQASAPSERPPRQSDCVHHWLIETQPGPASPGVCQKCGVRKLFANALAEGQRDEGEINLAEAS